MSHPTPSAEPDADAIPEADSSADPDAATASNTAPPSEHRFFAWLRSLAIVRRPGWIGGVCAGLADRLGIDPVIVRGIVVVIAVLGGPAILLYAVAWLLLPDVPGRIQLQQLARGHFASPLVGIAVLVMLSLLPAAQGFWWLGATFWGQPDWGFALVRALWTLLVLAAIIVVIAWAGRRRSRLVAPVVFPAPTDAEPTLQFEPTPPPDPQADHAVKVDAAPLVAEPQPTQPEPDVSAEELAAWREQQELWKQHHAHLKEQEAQAQREAREQRAADMRELAHAERARAAEHRRVRKLANPRLSAPLTFVAIGAAVLGGALAALIVSTVPGLSGAELVAGLGVGTLVLGLSIVAAGTFRRRSGILSFLAVLSVLGMIASAFVPPDRTLLWPSAGIWSQSEGSFAQPVGHLSITIDERSGEGVIDVWQGQGDVQIFVADGSAVRLELASPNGVAQMQSRSYGNGSYWAAETEVLYAWGSGDHGWASRLVGDEADAEITTIRIWQGGGYILVYDENLPPGVETPTKEPTTTPDPGAQPTPTPIPEETRP